ncbi:hypothetical protein [Paenibacillus popilliae]|uniref:DNA-binding domain-containing protein n=1 Tax=Paenibacillus popilliae ATCC 14706 TaxID=1212764 RepID=M9LGP3_PAEPP|nr:hypothetical protein [Paenibacillus popilliae]GAC41760.1 DNA-binding domain-containing protein [Paenibacillus popilliae ATCC 14706]
METKLLHREQVKELCNVFDIDLSVLQEDVPAEDWNEDLFLLDKRDFFIKPACADSGKKTLVEKECVYRQNMYVIDSFPQANPKGGKFPQLEEFYRQEDKHGLHSLYFQEEKKFLHVLSKLWAYSFVYLESSLLRNDLPDEVQKNELFQSTKQLFSKEGIVTTDEWENLEYLFALSLKNVVTTCVYFTDLKLVLWLDRLRATLYLCDKEQEDLIRTICMTEGLYLRK